MPFTLAEGLEIFVTDGVPLVSAIEAMVEAEKTAVTFADKQKLSEPVQEKLAALIDKVRAKAAD